uniref:Uncharacterized protein n=1 Tax=viral metagenome TaxID=1070528 RepID=A0A6C0DNF5_9ZZZZ
MQSIENTTYLREMAALLMKKYGADTVKRCFDEQWMQSSQEDHVQVNTPLESEDEIMDMSLEEEVVNESDETKESEETKESQESEETKFALESSSSSLNSEKKPRIVYKKTKLDSKKPIHIVDLNNMPDLVKKIRSGEIPSPTPSVSWTDGVYDPHHEKPQAILSYLALNGSKTKKEIIESSILPNISMRKNLIQNHLRELLEQGLIVQ